jgi:hypothetical protein
MAHDDKPNATTTLFAVLNAFDGRVVGRCMRRPRHQEFNRFLNAVEAAVPAGEPIHAIVRSDAAHKHPKLIQWLARHPAGPCTLRRPAPAGSTPSRGFFAKLSKRCLKRGVVHSLVLLRETVNRFLRETNAEPKPFRWTRTPDTSIGAGHRGGERSATEGLAEAKEIDPLRPNQPPSCSRLTTLVRCRSV